MKASDAAFRGARVEHLMGDSRAFQRKPPEV